MEVKPGYKRSEVGMIPVDWEVEDVEHAFDICNELRLPLSQTVRERMVGPYPYYGPTNIQGWINHYRVEGEYALIGEDGDHFLKWQSQPMTLLVRGKFNVNNHAHLVRGRNNLTRWFYWYFANRDLTPYLTRQGAGRYKLTKASLLKIPCALPPPSEQSAIAEALSDVDALLDGLNRVIVKKRHLKQATMQHLLSGGKRLPGFNEEWKERCFGELAAPRTERLDPRIISTIDYCVELEHIQPISGRLLGWTSSAESSSLKTTFRTGDILFGKLRAYLRKYWLATRPGVCSTEIWAFGPNLRLVKSEYLFQLVQADRFIETASAAYGTHMPRSDWNVVKSYEVRMPPIPEQAAIAEVLTDMDAEIAALEQRREKTRALKQAVMQELLTGKKRLI